MIDYFYLNIFIHYLNITVFDFKFYSKEPNFSVHKKILIFFKNCIKYFILRIGFYIIL